MLHGDTTWSWRKYETATFLKGGEEVVLGIDKLGQQKHKVFPYKE